MSTNGCVRRVKSWQPRSGGCALPRSRTAGARFTSPTATSSSRMACRHRLSVTNLLAAGEHRFRDDAEQAVERSLRVLLGKTPVKSCDDHALSPESAPSPLCTPIRGKNVYVPGLTGLCPLCSIPAQRIAGRRGIGTPPASPVRLRVQSAPPLVRPGQSSGW